MLAAVKAVVSAVVLYKDANGFVVGMTAAETGSDIGIVGGYEPVRIGAGKYAVEVTLFMADGTDDELGVVVHIVHHNRSPAPVSGIGRIRNSGGGQGIGHAGHDVVIIGSNVEYQRIDNTVYVHPDELDNDLEYTVKKQPTYAPRRSGHRSTDSEWAPCHRWVQCRLPPRV